MKTQVIINSEIGTFRFIHSLCPCCGEPLTRTDNGQLLYCSDINCPEPEMQFGAGDWMELAAVALGGRRSLFGLRRVVENFFGKVLTGHN